MRYLKFEDLRESRDVYGGYLKGGIHNRALVHILHSRSSDPVDGNASDGMTGLDLAQAQVRAHSKEYDSMLGAELILSSVWATLPL